MFLNCPGKRQSVTTGAVNQNGLTFVYRAHFLSLYGRLYSSLGTVFGTGILLADQRGIEPPPATFQRRQERCDTN